MPKLHLKRLVAPSSWPIARKSSTFIARPSPGPKSFARGMPIVVVLREVLGVVKTTKEAKYLLQKGEVLINGQKRKDSTFPVGVFDVLSIPSSKVNVRGTLAKNGKIRFVNEKEGGLIVRKVINKTCVHGKFQINCEDGFNLLSDKNQYNVGDALVFDAGSNVVKTHWPLQVGSPIFLVGGSHVGEQGELSSMLGSRITFKTQDSQTFETSRSFAMVIGKDKPEINLVA